MSATPYPVPGAGLSFRRMDDALERLRAALVGRYQVEVLLGQGGMATVYRAWDGKHERSVAIKQLRPELANRLGVERFLREIKTTAGFTHPHILSLYDSGEDDGLLYYVMPYIEGETLRGRLVRDGALPISDALRIAREVAEALAYAHDHGVIHRDIKPDNILFSAGGALVADFGIARAFRAASLEPLTKTDMIVGTLLYMSPEQAAGKAEARSDIYSLGCVLYEMLVGSPPFTGPPETLIARHAFDPPPSIRSVRPTVPDAVERIVFQALAKAPADRFATAAQFAEALRTPPDPLVDVEVESIAVLPFANLSADPEADYFSDGITEEIINALARIPGLRVAARTSCFAFRGKAAELADIGAKLRVATVLEGSVRRAGQQLRITAQLVKVRDGFQVWSEQYDRDLEDVFAIQEEIARMIVDRLKVTLGDGQRAPVVTPPTKSLDAYHLYLKGRYYWQQRGFGLKKALECFGQALALDPDYALAHAGLADACSLVAQYGFAQPERMLSQAHASARRALELAPELAEAHCASGTLALLFDWDWRRAATDLRRAIELNPRYDAARYWLAFYLTYIEGRFEEGVAHAERAVALDPLAALPAAQLGLVLIGASRYEAAIGTLERSIALDAGLFLPYLMLGVLYEHLERSEEAYATLETAVAVSGRHPWTLAHLAVSASSLGRLEEAQAIHDELYARTRREYVQSAMLALVTAAVGRVDEAFALLERACEERDGILFYSRRYPAFKVLKRDTRMNGIYRQIGFPE